MNMFQKDIEYVQQTKTSDPKWVYGKKLPPKKEKYVSNNLVKVQEYPNQLISL